MRKYWAFYKAGLQKMFVYRGPMIIWVIGNVLSFLTIVGVILSSQSGETLGGYTKPELITYYLIGIFFGWLNITLLQRLFGKSKMEQLPLKFFSSPFLIFGKGLFGSLPGILSQFLLALPQ